jgi:hypothetical protein
MDEELKVVVRPPANVEVPVVVDTARRPIVSVSVFVANEKSASSMTALFEVKRMRPVLYDAMVSVSPRKVETPKVEDATKA